MDEDIIIKLENNSVHREEINILSDISWEIKKNEHWALIGPNGSGKTTLLKIISGYIWPSSGKVSVLGEEFGKTDIRELRKKIGWVGTFLLEKLPPHQKVIDVVLSGKESTFGIYNEIKKEDLTKAEMLLDKMGCFNLKDRKFNIISQGERQKVLIARSLMSEPLILILDEPCTGLDPKARENLLSNVSKLCKENHATIIYVTHHLEEIVPEITNVMMIKDGLTFKQGNRIEVMNEKNVEQLFI